MEMDVNLSKISAIELVNVSSSAGALNIGGSCGMTSPPPRPCNNHHHFNHNHHNNNGSAERSLRNCASTISNNNNNHYNNTPTTMTPTHKSGCCGVLGRLLKSCRNSGKTASSSIGDFNSYDGLNVIGGGGGGGCGVGSYISASGGGISSISSSIAGSTRKTHHRRTPQEIYFESRGKSCKKLLKFNGSSNKILLYPEEGWARTASSSYWTITPCWWQPNRCRIEEFMGSSQRHSTKAKMVPLEQKGSLLIAGNFGRSRCKSSKKHHHGGSTRDHEHDDEFKLYLSSNISMEDYNMGYCLTGFVERRCQQTNTFQMTHFAVIKRQWPSISSDTKST